MVAVLGVTAALVSYAAAVRGDEAHSPADADLGPARMELTVDPARPGTNEVAPLPVPPPRRRASTTG